MAVKAEQSPVQVLDGFTPGDTLNEVQMDAMSRLAKYERIATDRETELPPYARIVPGDESGLNGQDIVAVYDKASGFTGVIHRQLTASVKLDEVRTARQYRIVGFKPCSRDEALAIVWAPRQAEAVSVLGNLVAPGEEPF